MGAQFIAMMKAWYFNASQISARSDIDCNSVRLACCTRDAVSVWIYRKLSHPYRARTRTATAPVCSQLHLPRRRSAAHVHGFWIIVSLLNGGERHTGVYFAT